MEERSILFRRQVIRRCTVGQGPDGRVTRVWQVPQHFWSDIGRLNRMRSWATFPSLYRYEAEVFDLAKTNKR
ncbi:hypothetical protein TNIN_48751 [Trichonephila inaurata madagascariensis]|uniref:Uncharacterized protein n=1 Tax=Trichonephila inaurata madagascariensis TaxID=2747483 RepID=A0A8X6XSP7_9ARAC|nr:hypothetical protein TNIN_48751 [Trichonephila inaurata madagascariensis]